MSTVHLPPAARGLPEELHELLHQQHGLLAVAQLREAGVTREALRWGLARRWSTPLPGVIQIGGGDLDETGRVIAAVLYAGQGGMLAGPSAVAWYGVRRAQTPWVHLIVPGSRAGRRHAWVIIHRSVIDDPGARIVRGVPVCSPARGVVDAARWSTEEDAVAIVIEACQRRITTTAHVRDQLALFSTAPGTARARRALAAAETGAWSVPEFDLLRLVATSSILPTAWANPSLVTADGRRLTTPDLWFDDVALAVMVHSKAHHLIGDDWSRTVEADGRLAAAGVTVIGVTPTTIRTDPRAALRLIEEAYVAVAGRQRPRPAVIARRRP